MSAKFVDAKIIDADFADWNLTHEAAAGVGMTFREADSSCTIAYFANGFVYFGLEVERIGACRLTLLRIEPTPKGERFGVTLRRGVVSFFVGNRRVLELNDVEDLRDAVRECNVNAPEVAAGRGFPHVDIPLDFVQLDRVNTAGLLASSESIPKSFSTIFA